MKKVLDFTLFKNIYFIFCILYVFPLTMELCAKLSKFFLIWGMVVLLYDIIKNAHKYNNSKYFSKRKIILALFQSVVLIGAVTNFTNLASHLILSAYSIIQTFVFSDERNDDSNFLFWLYLAFSSVCSIGSLIIFFSNYTNTFTINGLIMPFGLYDGRLYGFFSNPNNTSLVAWISIVISMYMLRFGLKKSNRLIIIILAINLILNFIVLSLGNSRSVLIMLLVFCFCFIFILLNNKNRVFKLFSACSVAVGLFFASQLSNSVMLLLQTEVISIFENEIVSTQQITLEQEVIQSPSASIPPEQIVSLTPGNDALEVSKESDSNRLDRESVGSYKRSGSERLEIWNTGLQAVVSSPRIFLFGVGNDNILQVCQTINTNAGAIYSNMHNIYLQVLLGSGVFSLIIFLSYFIVLFKQVVKNRSSSVMFWGSVNFAFLISGLFDSNLLYFMNLLSTASFWFFLGMLNQSLSEVKDKE